MKSSEVKIDIFFRKMLVCTDVLQQTIEPSEELFFVACLVEVHDSYEIEVHIVFAENVTQKSKQFA